MDLPRLDNIQAIVARRFSQPSFAVLLLGIGKAEGARSFVRNWLQCVRHGAATDGQLKGPLLSLGFTWAGLERVLQGHPELDSTVGATILDFGFTDQTPDHPGLREQLGFVGHSAPDEWWDNRFTNDDIHIAVYIAADDKEQLDACLAEVRETAADCEMRELALPSFDQAALSGIRPEHGILHFGYRDGITSPQIDWTDSRLPGTTDFREFVMGYPSEQYEVPPVSPGPWFDFARDGSFACLTWIHQDVASFNRYLQSNAAAVAGLAPSGIEEEWLAAKLMGRWRDGSPLTLYPDRPPVESDPSNGFDFADDPEGLRCPVTSHIRVVDPRNDELTFPNHRRFPAGPPKLLRRGFSYGSTLSGLVDDGAERGLVGTFICSRVNEQFYTVLRWMNQTSFSEHVYRKPYNDRMQDGICGNRQKTGSDRRLPLILKGGESIMLRLDDFLRFRGVCVFMLPSMSSLRLLAEQ